MYVFEIFHFKKLRNEIGQTENCLGSTDLFFLSVTLVIFHVNKQNCSHTWPAPVVADVNSVCERKSEEAEWLNQHISNYVSPLWKIPCWLFEENVQTLQGGLHDFRTSYLISLIFSFISLIIRPYLSVWEYKLLPCESISHEFLHLLDLLHTNLPCLQRHPPGLLGSSYSFSPLHRNTTECTVLPILTLHHTYLLLICLPY